MAAGACVSRSAHAFDDQTIDAAGDDRAAFFRAG